MPAPVPAMPFSHLLVPSDGSELSRAAIAQAVELAGRLGARITFLHVLANVPVPLGGLGEALDPRTLEALITANRQDSERILAAAAAMAEAAGVPADCERVMGDLPHRGIVATAERLGCDLIVMASHGRRGLGGLLIGSETQRVLSQAPCPVLVHR
jgi:nucleotide-binding universal stress UspA family protein